MVDEGIGEDVIVGGQLRERQRLLLGLGPWRHCPVQRKTREMKRERSGASETILRRRQTGTVYCKGQDKGRNAVVLVKGTDEGMLLLGVPSIAPESNSAPNGTLVGTSPALCRVVMRRVKSGMRWGRVSRRHQPAGSQ